MDLSRIGSFFVSHLWMLPFFLVYLFGIVYAVANWSRCPSAAGLATLAIVILLGTLVAGVLVNVMLFDLRVLPPSINVGTVSSVVSFLRNLIEAVATGMLIAAVFTGRGVAPRKAPGDIAGQYKPS